MKVPTPPSLRRRTRIRRLKPEEIIDIIHRVLIRKFKVVDVAELKGVS